MLSTHIMQEVEAICDRVIIINKGKVVADERPETIQNKVSDQTAVIIVEFDKEVDKQLIESIEGATKVIKHKENTWLIESSANNDIRGNIFNFAVKQGLTILSQQKQEKSLEDVFKLLTK